MRRTAVSLFTGAGGLDYGFEAAGFSTRVAVESDPDCCRTLRNNRRWRVYEGDLLKASTAALLKMADITGSPDIVIGGPPCQPFSKSGFWVRGETACMRDPRAATLRAFLRVIEEAQPKAFLLENVAGMASSSRDEALAMFLEAIHRINSRTKSRYEPRYGVLNAADYGVPQIRHRLFIVAARDGATFTFPPPLLSPARFRTAWDALGDLPWPTEHLELTGKWRDLLPSIPEGANYLFHTPRGQGRPLFGWRTRYWSFLLKLAKNRPSWTIQAQPGPATGPFHWSNRRLSVRELCRLQTLPDDIVIAGSRLSICRQIGNAVPSVLAEILAREIRRQLFGDEIRSDPKLLREPLGNPPRANRRRPIPAKYLLTSSIPTEHPGTGKGPRAKAGFKTAA